MINAKLQNLYNIKNDIGTAIVNKGGTITESTPFYSYAGQIDNISTGAGSYVEVAIQDINGVKYTPATNIVESKYDGNLIGTNESVMPFVASSNQRGGMPGMASSPNDANVYVVGGSTLSSVNKNTLSVTNAPSGAASSLLNIYTDANDGNLYVIGFSGIVQKANKANLVYIANAANVGGLQASVASSPNNPYLFVGESGKANTVFNLYWKENLAFVNTLTRNIGTATIRSIYTTDEEDFVYATASYGTSGNVVLKFWKSNLTYVGQTANYGQQIHRVISTPNDPYIYITGDHFLVTKYWKENLALVANSGSYGSWINTASTYDNSPYLYVGGQPVSGTNRGVSKISKENLAFIANTPNYTNATNGTTIYGVYVSENDDNVYAAGDAGVVSKYTKFAELYEQKNYYAFNKWLINNDTNSSVILTNAKVEDAGIFNGVNHSLDINNMGISANTAYVSNASGVGIRQIYSENNNLYAYYTVSSGSLLYRYHLNNLVYQNNSQSLGSFKTEVAGNFIYGFSTTFGSGSGFLSTYHINNFAFINQKSNMILDGNTSNRILNYFGSAINNGKIYIGYNRRNNNQLLSDGFFALDLQSQNLLYQTPFTPNVGYGNAGGMGYTVKIYNGILYETVGGGFGQNSGNFGVRAWAEHNLAYLRTIRTGVFANGSVSYPFGFGDFVINNGYLYAVWSGGSSNAAAQRVFKANLATGYLEETSKTDFTNLSDVSFMNIAVNNGFIYVTTNASGNASTKPAIVKFHEHNLGYINSYTPLQFLQGGTFMGGDVFTSAMSLINNNIYIGARVVNGTAVNTVILRQENVVYDNIAAYEVKSYKEEQ
jgi:hypothetical protein